MKPYYQHAGIEIYHGDCREVLPVINFDVLVTDPPYGVNLGNHYGAREQRPGFLKKQAYASYEDSRDNFVDEIVPAVILGLNKAKRGAVFCAGKNIWDFPRADSVGGVYLPAATGRQSWGFNSIAHLLLYGKAPDLEKGSRAIAIESAEISEQNGHPCPKPEGWMRFVVALASRASETVCDPFMGSGTTLRAAKD